MFKEWRLDNDSCCYFCGVGPESIYHLFGTCEKLKGLWEILSEVHLFVTMESLNYKVMRRNFHLDFSTVSCNSVYEKSIIYLNTIANYSIWRHMNDIRYKFAKFDLEVITKKMIRSIGARRGSELHMSESFKIPYITQLYDALIVATTHYPFDRG